MQKYFDKLTSDLEHLIEKSHAPWESPNPKKKHSHLTPQQKSQAKARAKKAGRPYPNLVDNMAVMKK
jgi:hypothetical protein